MVARLGRNEPCRCGSGRKYKHCCLDEDESKARAAHAKTMAEAPAPSADAVAAPPRAPKHETQQPWKATSRRGSYQRLRMPPKVGGG